MSYKDLEAPEEETPLSQSHYVTVKVRLHHLCCDLESKLVTDALQGMKGIDTFRLNVLGRTVLVRYNPDLLDAAEIVITLNKYNLGAAIKEAVNGKDQLPPEAECQQEMLQLSATYVCGFQTVLLVLAFGGRLVLGWTSGPFLVLAVGTGLLDLLRKLLGRAFNGHIAADMPTLMFTAGCGALFLGELWEAAAMLWLYYFAHVAEHAALSLARARVQGCGDSLPRTATLADSGKEVLVSSLEIGDKVLVRAGESIPTDGHVAKFSGHVDEGSVTGESEPKKKHPGDYVIAGTLILDGMLSVKVGKEAKDSAAAKVQDMVEEAASSPSKASSTVESIAGWYSTCILFVALCLTLSPLYVPGKSELGLHGWTESLKTALVLLVLACPCALVTAIPIVRTCGVAAHAARGVLFKSAEAVDALAAITLVSFDKTGTLTDGQFTVQSQWHHPDCTSKHQEMLVAMESRSTHPIAAAIVGDHIGCMTDAVEALGMGLNLPEVESFEVVEGIGIRGTVAGHRVSIGSRKIVEGHHAILEEFAASNVGATLVFGVIDGKLFKAWALFDTPRSASAQVINNLSSLMVPSVLISGDRPEVVGVVGTRLGVSRAYGGQFPSDKVAKIRRWEAEGESVLMVGDGINDAPALKAASVGWAMGAGGTALAADTADIVGVTDDLTRIPESIHAARFYKVLVLQNIAIAILPKLFLASLAVFSTWRPPLWLAVTADTGSLLFVIFNGLRAFG